MTETLTLASAFSRDMVGKLVDIRIWDKGTEELLAENTGVLVQYSVVLSKKLGDPRIAWELRSESDGAGFVLTDEYYITVSYVKDEDEPEKSDLRHFGQK